MNFQEIYNEVIIITKRPDLVDRTKQAIRSATIKAHHSDLYFKDLIEVSVQFANVFYLQSFLPTEVVPNFRLAKYIRLWNGDVNGSRGPFLKNIQIENSLNLYGNDKTNVFYMAGQLLQIRGTCEVKNVLFGCYVNPVITPETAYSSWVAVEQPYAIVYEAARQVFKSISYTEQATEYSNLVAEEYAELKLTYVDSVPVT